MNSDLGGPGMPLRAAIVGAGPSGFYAAESLLGADKNITVDMFERLPAPYGLVRYGVAPDHIKIKNVIKVYEKIAEKPRFSFLGNVTVGKDISVEDLKRFYDVILFSFGAEADRKLGIPGEDLRGSHTATEFVAWYNGHPDYRDKNFDLSGRVAVVIGHGNVAVDVCRILSKTVDELCKTDIAQHALDTLKNSKIEEIHMVGRRGPAQAAFTPVEIRELGNLSDCSVILNPEDFNINEASRQELADPQNPRPKKTFEILQQLVDKQDPKKRKKLFIHFLKSPLELQGGDRVKNVVFEDNQLIGNPGRQKARATGKTEELACDIFFRSIGYHGTAIAGVPFDEQSGVIPNQEGRVVSAGRVLAGFYVAGWIKRGPTGIIGTNKPDSDETVRHILEDISHLTPATERDTQSLIELLNKKGVRVVSFPDWKKIDAQEIARGVPLGKPREKFTAIAEMLSVVSS